jgi:Histidine kinase-like ATPase domain
MQEQATNQGSRHADPAVHPGRLHHHRAHRPPRPRRRPPHPTATAQSAARATPAVICDLSGVWTLDPACASVFATTAHHPASGTPKLLLCGAQPEVATILTHLPAPHRLPLYQRVEDAINQAFDDAIDQTLNHPVWLHQELELAPSPTAPAAARRFVRALCTSWDLLLADDPDDPAERAWLADRVDQAVLVTSELVTNAVIHAQSELRVLVELHGTQLHLAVQDASPHLLRLVTAPDLLEEGGRGLLLVESLATSWQVQHPPRAARSSLVCSTSPTDPLPHRSSASPTVGGAEPGRPSRMSAAEAPRGWPSIPMAWASTRGNARSGAAQRTLRRGSSPRFGGGTSVAPPPRTTPLRKRYGAAHPVACADPGWGKGRGGRVAPPVRHGPLGRCCPWRLVLRASSTMLVP